MFAKRRANMRNLDFCTFCKLCAPFALAFSECGISGRASGPYIVLSLMQLSGRRPFLTRYKRAITEFSYDKRRIN